MRFGIVGLVVFIGAYIASIVLYVNGGMGHPRQVAESSVSGDGTMVKVDIEDIESDNSVLRANVTVIPGPALLDPQTHNLKEDLSVVITSVVTASKRTWAKGTPPDVFPVSITLAGDVADWPFDRYHSGSIAVQLFSGAMQVPERATVTLVDRLLGWKVHVARVSQANVPAAYQLDLRRTLSTAAFGVVILGVLISLAALGFFVAIKTVRDQRKFQPPMTTWYAAMLFAVMPLRNALPDSPPFGAWIDVTVVLWVIVVLVIAMTLYISCWWRHLRPDADKAQNLAKPVTAD
ncbi:MAG TPA: DUF4436 domain-containing protein [Mycobacterium sp.]|jgi:uncharacterized protein YneF (UPF0154 family)|nr:DUF4436 domain-containing protein [Mycobacterium sp.]